MKITIVAGARPNFMKIAPLCRAMDAAREAGQDITYRVVRILWSIPVRKTTRPWSLPSFPTWT